MSKPKRDLTKITLNLPVHMIDMIDEYAANVGINRTAAITILLANKLGDMYRDKE